MSYFIRLDGLCKAQLLAEAAVRGRGGELVIVGDEEVQVSVYIVVGACTDCVISLRSTIMGRSIMHG
jgi:hypothetical protein